MTPSQKRRKRDQFIIRKWNDRILNYQATQRLRGSYVPSAHELAGRFEAEQSLQKQHSRNQALRASGQIAEAQRADRHSFRLQRSGDWEDVRADQSLSGTTTGRIVYDEWANWTTKHDDVVDAWAVYASFGPQILAAVGVAERHQEVRPDPYCSSKHGRQTRKRVR